MEALGQALSPLSGIEGRFKKAVEQAGLQRQHDVQSQMESDYLGLQPVQQAGLWRLLDQAQRFRRYDADALRFYQHQTGKKVPRRRPESPWKTCASTTRHGYGGPRGASLSLTMRLYTRGIGSRLLISNGWL